LKGRDEMEKKRQFYDFDLRKEKAANELKLDAMNMIVGVYRDQNMTADAKNKSIACLVVAAAQAIDRIEAI
jgi:hypothetical protein